MATQDYHTKLVTKEGEEISCTIKTPKLKLVREFRRNQRSFEVVRREFAIIDAAEAQCNDRIDAIRAALAKPDANAKQLNKELAGLLADRETIIKQKDENDAAVYSGLCDTADMVLNYPNKKTAADTPQRTKEDIDWDESELTEIRGAIDFFADAASKSSFDSRG